jgi:uncharacterized membrane protein
MLNKIKRLFLNSPKKSLNDYWMFIVILIMAILGLVAAFILSVEAWELAKNPNAVFECSVNLVVNCATVAKSQYATLFGFPNSFMGMVFEPIFVLLGVLLLIGVKLPKRFMFIMQFMAGGALLFAFYLFYISTALIGALCPWCMLVMSSTTIMFFAITKYNIVQENLYLSKDISNKFRAFIGKDYDKLLLALIFLVIAVIVVTKYGSGLFA